MKAYPVTTIAYWTVSDSDDGIHYDVLASFPVQNQVQDIAVHEIQSLVIR